MFKSNLTQGPVVLHHHPGRLFSDVVTSLGSQGHGDVMLVDRLVGLLVEDAGLLTGGNSFKHFHITYTAHPG